MKAAKEFFVVLVTAPDLKTARALAKSALHARLIACANLVPRIESHYWWQGNLEAGNEVLMILKTTRRRLAALEKLILAQHPYDTAEFLVLPLHAGADRYLAWLGGSCGDGK
ncbi:MAG: divalent cation tolerance protein CutA [Verrucomicrobia bacterium]|nr:divalent cation tolerance protein CutA [Verrucomicrobiota bacterium]